MRAGHDEHVGRRGDGLSPQARRKRIDDREQRQVDLAAFELRDQARRSQPRRAQLHRYGGVPRVIATQQPRHVDKIDARHEPHRHGSSQLGRRGGDRLADLAHLLEHRLSARQQLLPGTGESDLPMRTVEQLDTQFTFQLAHGGRHRRLREQQTVGRPREAHLPRHGDEDGEVAHIHASIMPRSRRDGNHLRIR